ncbi:MAG: DUF1697 domain-containing protein [Bacteroidota bacterium]
MKTYVALLRGINVGGKRKIKMADLKKLFESLSFSEITTYIQSGNVIFDVPTSCKTSVLTNQITKEIEKEFGFEVPVQLIEEEVFQNSFSENPFLKENVSVANLHLTFLSETPRQEAVQKLKEIDCAPDEFQIVANKIFLHCENPYHKTKLNNTLIERKLELSATTRNWKTISKLVALLNQRKNN